jgi:hypothetical protein
MLNFFFPPSLTMTGAFGPPAGVYTRSVVPDIVTGADGEVVVLIGTVTLSMYVEASRPVIETAEMS